VAGAGVKSTEAGFGYSVLRALLFILAPAASDTGSLDVGCGIVESGVVVLLILAAVDLIEPDQNLEPQLSC